MSDLGDVKLHFVENVDDAQEMLRWLSEDRGREILGFDLETSGLKDYRDRIRLAQIGDEHGAWAVPWQRWSGVIIEALSKYQGPLVGHNVQFDQRHWRRDIGSYLPWERMHDTMLLAHVDNPVRSKGLKSLTSTLVDRSAAAGQDALTKYMSDNKLGWDTIPVDNPYYWGYGAMDVVLTTRLFNVLEPKVRREAWTSYELELAAARICANMTYRGARYDRVYCQQKSEELRAWVAKARKWCLDEYGIKNATSILQLVDFFEKQGFEFEKMTPKGGYALDKEVLEGIDHPVAETVLKIRKAVKICSTYLDNFGEFSDDRDFVHADIWVCGARTSRMSITDPALQTLPKQDKIVRNAFIPRDGHRLVSTDADQIELRLMAYFADDPGLKAAFESDQSFFVTVAEQALGEKIDKDTDPRYKMIKSSVYARLYGAGDAKIAKTAGVPVEVIKNLNKGFDDAYPGVKRLIDSVGRKVMERAGRSGDGWVVSNGGRRLPVERDKPYVGVNYLIQASAAETFKRALVDLDAAGFGDYMLLPVHDEILLDVPAEDAETIAKEVSEVMTDRTRFGLPITWSSDVHEGAWGGRKLA